MAGTRKPSTVRGDRDAPELGWEEVLIRNEKKNRKEGSSFSRKENDADWKRLRKGKVLIEIRKNNNGDYSK